jgi:hypothetical protein
MFLMSLVDLMVSGKVSPNEFFAYLNPLFLIFNIILFFSLFKSLYILLTVSEGIPLNAAVNPVTMPFLLFGYWISYDSLNEPSVLRN